MGTSHLSLRDFFHFGRLSLVNDPFRTFSKNMVKKYLFGEKLSFIKKFGKKLFVNDQFCSFSKNRSFFQSYLVNLFVQ